MKDFDSDPIRRACERAAEIANERMVPDRYVGDEAVADQIVSMAGRYGFRPDQKYVEPIRAILSRYGVLLTGPAGTGKTFLMQCMGYRVIHVNDIAHYGLSHIRNWHEWKDGWPICIDDLGTEATTSEYGAKEDLMKLVIAHRAERQPARTHFTTNLTAEQIAARYGDRTLSRLLGMCKAFRFDGESQRTPKRYRA